jgi:hypothetical protein
VNAGVKNPSSSGLGAIDALGGSGDLGAEDGREGGGPEDFNDTRCTR